MTVIALIAKAGGLLEYADSKHIVVIRHEKKANGQPDSLIVNYKDWAQNKNLQQNVELRPGDIVIVKS
jgi:protein involved in polysaccharide export with SLBB domain